MNSFIFYLYLFKSGANLQLFAQSAKKCAKIVSNETIFIDILSPYKE